MRINSLYYKQNINIAFPIMLSLAGQAIVQMADNIMVGQLGAPEPHLWAKLMRLMIKNV